jgi:hypothetical protein
MRRKRQSYALAGVYSETQITGIIFRKRVRVLELRRQMRTQTVILGPHSGKLAANENPPL